ncbi:hypothetical protein DRN63_02895 [Nanoarchaeota archaeon]|nr:MAG: hypothetical protein DRN63_02895 [Nanoarchaeota archaeon]
MATREEWKRIEEWSRKLLLMSDKQRLEFMKKVFELCENPLERCVLALFYIYGLRPREALSLRKKNFNLRENELAVVLPTAKGGRERILVLPLKTPFLDYILEYLNYIEDEDQRLFEQWFSPTALNNILLNLERKFRAIYDKDICLSPYVFRKFRISWLLAKGASPQEVLIWKGGRSIKVVEEHYFYTKPLRKVIL